MSKIAIVVLLLSLAGVGTVWAANYFKVKSYNHKINLVTKNELEDLHESNDYISIDYNNVIKKRYGQSINKELRSPSYDNKGNILIPDEEGYYTLEDGTRFPASFIPDPERYEKAKLSGDEVFTEMGYPNLIPTFIYDNYILDPNGFGYYHDPVTSQTWINVQFLTDAYNGGDFFKENIWITFFARAEAAKSPGSYFEVYNEKNYNLFNYTTKSGVLCSIMQYKDSNYFIVNISFDSETIGNGDFMFELKGIEWDKLVEILDTLPLSEENVDSHIGISNPTMYY